MEVYIPDDIALTEASVSFSMTGYLKFVAELYRTRTELTTARAEAQTVRSLVAALDTHNQTLTAQATRLNEEIATLQARLIEAQTPPVIVPPPVVILPPANSRLDVWPNEPVFEVTRIIGATIENSMTEPSSTQYAAVKRAADVLQALGLTTVRFYLGPAEVAAHVTPATSVLGNLVDYVRDKKMHFIADGVDRVLALVDNAKLKAHVDGLKALRTWGLCWNDADKEPIDKLRADVERVRAAGWTGPILFSLRATAKLADYKIPGVYTEIQTFGSPDEFDQFAQSDADLLCLDTRTPQTNDQIKRLFDVALKSPRSRGYFLYTSKTRDWAATPADEVATIRAFVQRAKAQDMA